MQDSHAGSTAAPGALIAGRYRIESLLGRGGMAAVYRATDESLGRTVALKLFPSESTDASAIGRESSEIRLLASMNHHALVTLFDASVDATGDAERAFLVMELVEGPTLQKRIEQGPIPATEVALMATDLAEALHVVHAQGVVHRDIKPANILLSPALYPGREFRAKLADFGIAYLIDSTRLTTPGTLIGTAAYLSPEQANGSAPGPAADIYSLGLVLLEALTGVRAFPGTMVESLTARLMRSPEIPGALGYEWKSLLTAMTAMDPASRPSALDVVDVARRLGSDPATGAASTAFLAAATAAQTGTVAMEPPTPDTTTEQPTPTRVFDAQTAVQPTEQHAAPTAQTVAATAVLAPADPTSATERFPSATPASAASTSPDRTTPRGTVHERTDAPRSRAVRRMIVIVLILAVLVAGALVVWLNMGGSPAPELPAVDGDLGVHLKELMESVTP